MRSERGRWWGEDGERGEEERERERENRREVAWVGKSKIWYYI
jgi:hypothetical protein